MTGGKMKKKNPAVMTAAAVLLIMVSISFAFASGKRLRYYTENTTGDDTPIVIPINLSYSPSCECFSCDFQFSKIKGVIFKPKHNRIIAVHGLKRNGGKKVVLEVKLKKTDNKINFVDGIEALAFLVDEREKKSFKKGEIIGKEKKLEISVNKGMIKIDLEPKKNKEHKSKKEKKQQTKKKTSTPTSTITIKNYEQAKVFLKGGKIICYDKKNKPREVFQIDTITAPTLELSKGKGIVTIKIISPVLGEEKYPVDPTTNTAEIGMVKKSFAPIDKRSGKLLDNVNFDFHIKKDGKKSPIKEGIFKKEKKTLTLIYPAVCKHVYLNLKKGEYKELDIIEISKPSFKQVPGNNPVELEKISYETRVVVEVENGEGATVTTNGNRTIKVTDGKASFSVDPYQEKEFKVSKEGFKTFAGSFKPDQTLYQIKLEPDYTKVSFEIENGAGASVTIRGTNKIADGSGKVYFVIEPDKDKEFKISKEGFNTITGSLDPEKTEYEFKLDPIEPISNEIDVVFEIENGAGASIKGSNFSETADGNGNAAFEVNLAKDKEYQITKNGFKIAKGFFKQGKTIYPHKLEPIDIPTPLTLNSIPVINDYNYKGTVILTDNLRKSYEFRIPQSSDAIKIQGNEVKLKKLKPYIIEEAGVGFKISYSREKNVIEILPMWKKEMLTFDFTLKSCGKKKPKNISVFLENAIINKETGKTGQRRLRFPVGTNAQFQHKYFVEIPYFQEDVTALIEDHKDFMGKKFTIKKSEAFCFKLSLCKPPLAVVAFLTNSRKGLQTQDAIDTQLRKTFKMAGYFKPIYVGWVNYIKTKYQLKEFKNVNARQIEIPDTNTNDTAETTLGKIIKDIQQKFVGIKVEKQAPVKLMVILDKSTIAPTGENEKVEKYSTENFNVKLVDINEAENLIEIIKTED